MGLYIEIFEDIHNIYEVKWKEDRWKDYQGIFKGSADIPKD